VYCGEGHPGSRARSESSTGEEEVISRRPAPSRQDKPIFGLLRERDEKKNESARSGVRALSGARASREERRKHPTHKAARPEEMPDWGNYKQEGVPENETLAEKHKRRKQECFEKL
jgi:hypothetical protein